MFPPPSQHFFGFCLHPDLLYHCPPASSACWEDLPNSFARQRHIMEKLSVGCLPPNLFPSFGHDLGGSLAQQGPCWASHLQGLGIISALHRSAVRGHLYSCRTVWGVPVPGIFPCNIVALSEPGVSSLLLTLSSLALPRVSFPSPSAPIQPLFSPVSPKAESLLQIHALFASAPFFYAETFCMCIQPMPSPASSSSPPFPGPALSTWFLPLTWCWRGMNPNH